MAGTRRALLSSLAAGALFAAQDQLPQQPRPGSAAPNADEDQKLPNGKSQKDAIAKEQHEQALKDANELIAAAQALKDEIEKAGDYVLPLSSVKKTEEIEKLARRIRGRLKQ
jgi:hypothetical protein